MFNLLGQYDLPFGRRGNRAVKQIAGGWSVAPIFSAYSGLPRNVQDGSGQEFGQGTASASSSAIRIAPNTFGHSVHSGVAGDPKTQIGISGDPARAGTGMNLFANPVAVYNSFRPILVGQDTTSYGGQIRGQSRWNLDLSLIRKIKFNERVSTTFSAQFFNIFNHVMFDDPALNLQSPSTFGVITTQINTPRIVQLGLHFDF